MRQVARGTGAAGRSLRRATLVFSAMLVTGNELLPEERRYTDEELQLMIGSQRAALARQHAVDLRALHCAYRDVDTSVLRGAADFLSGPAGHWMRSSVDAAFERALLGAAESTAQRIVDTFGTSPPAAPLRTALR